MKRIITILVLMLCITNVSAATTNEKETVKFKKCVDGDTAVFTRKEEDIRVRFLGIDTPESVHPTKEVEAFGKDASEYTCTKITKAKKIVLEYDAKSTKLDKYGRTLAWVWVDGSLLQKELVEVGYAQVKYVYGKYSHLDELNEAQEKAKEKEYGIWSDYTAPTYTVTFINGKDETKVVVKENETVESLEVEKEGYTFLGWYQDDKEYNFNKAITSDVTLTAKYSKNLGKFEIVLIILGLIILYMINPKKFKSEAKKTIKKELKKI